jgi:hypothetical protein
MVHGVLHKYLTSDDMSVSKMSGKKQPGNKGTCDLLLYQAGLRDYLLECKLPTLGGTPEQQILVRNVF